MSRRTKLLIALGALGGLVAAPARPADAADCASLITKYKTHDYDWWKGALGHAMSGYGGITDFDTVLYRGWAEVPVAEQDACLLAHLRSSPVTAARIDEVIAFNTPLCQVLPDAYHSNGYRDWILALDSCLGGAQPPTTPHAVFECGFQKLPPSHRLNCLRDHLWKQPITTSTINVTVILNNPADCPALISTYQKNKYADWKQYLDNCKVGHGGVVERDDVFACGWNQVPKQDQRTCLREHLDAAGATTAAIAQVRRYNGIRGSIAENHFEEWFQAPEVCELPTDGSLPGGYYEPMMQPLLGDGFHKDGEGRLRDDLRQIARIAHPIACTLPHAAHTFARAAKVKDVVLHDQLIAEATALADLAVTGRSSFQMFRNAKLQANYCDLITTRGLVNGCPVFQPTVGDPDEIEGCTRALQRAYSVANHLRTGQTVTASGAWFDAFGMMRADAILDHRRKEKARDALRWIAVSGEDDLPHRPVNVPSSDWPQFDLDVTVHRPYTPFGLLELPFTAVPVTVETRYVIAQSREPSRSVATPGTYSLAPDYAPQIDPDAEILIFIHGMDSRAEEAGEISRALFARMYDSSKKLAIISVDLPTSGYAETLDYDVVSPLVAIGYPEYGDFHGTGMTPQLDFMEDFVVKFVETLDKDLVARGQPSILPRIRAVMGGSLGGNLTMRLGRRPNTSWIRNVVPWSPASVWLSFGETAAPIRHQGAARPWVFANDRDPADPDDLSPARLDRRSDFFYNSWARDISPGIITVTQPETWYSPHYKCAYSAMAAARLDRHETYDARFLSWRWRLATEQQLYSHASIDPLTTMERYMSNDKRMLLLCGQDDEVKGNHICDATEEIAAQMTLTPGVAISLEDTGHALHSERPAYLARKIDEFLGLH